MDLPGFRRELQGHSGMSLWVTVPGNSSTSCSTAPPRWDIPEGTASSLENLVFPRVEMKDSRE